MKTTRGVTLLELVVVCAVAGILMGIGFVIIPRGRFAVNQAAKIVAAQVTRARFEALRRNQPAGVYFDASGSGKFVVFEDKDASPVGFDSTDPVISETSLGTDELSRVKLALSKITTSGSTISIGSFWILFDTRGIRHATDNYQAAVSTQDESYTKYVCVTPQGSAEIGDTCS